LAALITGVLLPNFARSALECGGTATAFVSRTETVNESGGCAAALQSASRETD